MLEDLCLNLVTKVLEDWPFVLEDMWLKTTVFVLESDHICAGRFVLKSAHKSSRILSNDLQCRESGRSQYCHLCSVAGLPVVPRGSML